MKNDASTNCICHALGLYFQNWRKISMYMEMQKKKNLVGRSKSIISWVVRVSSGKLNKISLIRIRNKLEGLIKLSLLVLRLVVS